MKFLGVMCVLPGASKGVNPGSRAGGIRLGPSRSSGPETYEACAIRQTWGFPGGESVDRRRALSPGHREFGRVRLGGKGVLE